MDILGCRPGFAAEFEWLIEQGIIFEPEILDRELWKNAVQLSRDDQTFQELGELLEGRAKHPDWSKEAVVNWLST